MKLQNEETGQVENFCIDKDQICSCDRAFVYDSLAQLQEASWKDYEEPKDYWSITMYGGITKLNNDDMCLLKDLKEIGNCFDTKDKAYDALEKLKAWKRLKDKGIRFEGYDRNYGHWYINFTFDNYYCTGEPYSASDAMTICFGGEE